MTTILTFLRSLFILDGDEDAEGYGPI